jgi:hypothetical protein
MADTKNWTWVLQRRCPECGFDASQVRANDVAGATSAAVERYTELLRDDEVGARPEPGVWSALEYGAHVRDVFVVMGGRLASMLDEDDPLFANWDQDETAVEEHYGDQDPVEVTVALRADGGALAAAFAAVTDDQWARPGRRSDGSTFTVDSLGRYMLHDVVHHIWDIERGYASLRVDD